ncbi:hypothetical protein FRB97_006608 [Tulasnella sp. 331]|nr:hypothetical protein FRB97_006608 [Tulasnella sp. 331]
MQRISETRNSILLNIDATSNTCPPAAPSCSFRASAKQLTDLAQKRSNPHPYLIIDTLQVAWVSTYIGYFLHPSDTEIKDELWKQMHTLHLFVRDNWEEPAVQTYHGLVRLVEAHLPGLNNDEILALGGKERQLLEVELGLRVQCIGFQVQSFDKELAGALKALADVSPLESVRSPTPVGLSSLEPHSIWDMDSTVEDTLQDTIMQMPPPNAEGLPSEQVYVDSHCIAQSTQRLPSNSTSPSSEVSIKERQNEEALEQMELPRLTYLRALPILKTRPIGLQFLSNNLYKLDKKFRKASFDPSGCTKQRLCFIRPGAVCWVGSKRKRGYALALQDVESARASACIPTGLGRPWIQNASVELFDNLEKAEVHQYLGTYRMFTTEMPDLTLDDCMNLTKPQQDVLCRQAPHGALQWSQVCDGVKNGELRIACLAISLIGFNEALNQVISGWRKGNPSPKKKKNGEISISNREIIDLTESPTGSPPKRIKTLHLDVGSEDASATSLESIVMQVNEGTGPRQVLGGLSRKRKRSVVYLNAE